MRSNPQWLEPLFPSTNNFHENMPVSTLCTHWLPPAFQSVACVWGLAAPTFVDKRPLLWCAHNGSTIIPISWVKWLCCAFSVCQQIVISILHSHQTRHNIECSLHPHWKCHNSNWVPVIFCYLRPATLGLHGGINPGMFTTVTHVLLWSLLPQLSTTLPTPMLLLLLPLYFSFW